GGGFMLVYPTGGKDPVVFEYRETAPAAVNKDTFVNETSVHNHKAAGGPGTVRGMELAHKKFGKLPWKDVVLPSVKLAEEGFVLSEVMAKGINGMLKQTKQNAEFQHCFGKADGSEWKPGETLVQKDLGRTLRIIAEKGPDAFYTGELADMLE